MDDGTRQDGRRTGGGNAPADEVPAPVDGAPAPSRGVPAVEDERPPVEDERPWELPDYLHERELGAGASGRVVLARHRETGTPVAIKYLHSAVGTPALREEAEVLAAVDSPHVTRLYEYVEGERGSAIVMELVDGIALRDLLKAEGATTPEAALVVLKGSLLGLAAAHRAGVVHRDYKPANVLVDTAGTSKLVDFGIAVPSGDEGDVSGTPAYMPPEQWAGKPASPAGDVYAATVTFFECLTGARPYGGTTIAELAVQHTEAPIPAELAPDPVRPLILAGLAKEPQARPESAAALVEELEVVAVAAYGPDWEEKGRLDLTALVALLALLLPGAGGAAGGTSLAHTALGGVDASAGAETVTLASAAPQSAAPPSATVRELLVRRGARLGGRGKALVGVVAGTLTLATLAGVAIAGAADGGAHTVVGGATPEATTTLGAADPTTGAPSPSAGGPTDTPSAAPSPSAPSPSASSDTPSTSPTASPGGKTPTTKGTPPPGGGAPSTGLPPAPPGGTTPTVAAPPSVPPSTGTVPTATTAPTPTVAPATIAVSTVNLDSLTCSGRWSLSATVTVAAQGTGTGTLTLSWYHTSGGRSVTVATDTVEIRDGRATVTRAHDFGSADTFPTWGVRVSTSPAAAKPGKTSAEMAAFLCDPPR
ncbi:serine/threonine-protein kinase [Kitasatospora sp. NPDC127111]|uniref:serine/threonine-protein kinase n=1 Tax=Kitasatospora sp. NPDC127111 TaxID=3345363 RepID=UPI00363EFBE2